MEDILNQIIVTIALILRSAFYLFIAIVVIYIIYFIAHVPQNLLENKIIEQDIVQKFYDNQPPTSD